MELRDWQLKTEYLGWRRGWNIRQCWKRRRGSLSSTRRGVESGPSWSPVTEAPWPRVEGTEKRKRKEKETRQEDETEEERIKNKKRKECLLFDRFTSAGKEKVKGREGNLLRAIDQMHLRRKDPREGERESSAWHTFNPFLSWPTLSLSLFRTSEKRRDVSLTQPSLVCLCYYNISVLEYVETKNTHKWILKEYHRQQTLYYHVK